MSKSNKERIEELLDALDTCIDCAKAATKVQSVICSKTVFKSAAEARMWVTSHNFKASKIDETETSYRFRQFNPTLCKSGTFRNISLTKGVSAVICQPK